MSNDPPRASFAYTRVEAGSAWRSAAWILDLLEGHPAPDGVRTSGTPRRLALERL
jgi:hypothetical protein